MSDRYTMGQIEAALGLEPLEEYFRKRVEANLAVRPEMTSEDRLLYLARGAGATMRKACVGALEDLNGGRSRIIADNVQEYRTIRGYLRWIRAELGLKESLRPNILIVGGGSCDE